jgi:hypothetical protein
MLRYAEIAAVLGRRMDVRLINPIEAAGGNVQASSPTTTGLASIVDPKSQTTYSLDFGSSRVSTADDFYTLEAVL